MLARLPSSTQSTHTQSAIFFNIVEQIEHFETIPLENPLDKSDDRVPLPINLLARLAFQWPDCLGILKTNENYVFVPLENPLLEALGPEQLTIWVKFYVESEFSGPGAQFLSPDRVFWKNVPYKKFVL